MYVVCERNVSCCVSGLRLFHEEFYIFKMVGGYPFPLFVIIHYIVLLFCRKLITIYSKLQLICIRNRIFAFVLV